MIGKQASVYTSPIIFSAPMIRALLADHKVQTRRFMTSQWANVKMHHEMGKRCLLWARETVSLVSSSDLHLRSTYYRADFTGDSSAFTWKPSIHMPRWASRLTLEVADVRLQRLQDISEEDSLAEGITHTETDSDGQRWFSLPEWNWQSLSAPAAYRTLWESLHGEGSWDADPEIVAFTFQVHRQNVDAIIGKDVL